VLENKILRFANRGWQKKRRSVEFSTHFQKSNWKSELPNLFAYVMQIADLTFRCVGVWLAVAG